MARLGTRKSKGILGQTEDEVTPALLELARGILPDVLKEQAEDVKHDAERAIAGTDRPIPWPPLSPEWAAEKVRRGQSPLALRGPTGDLATFTIKPIKNGQSITSAAPYALVHNLGTSKHGIAKGYKGRKIPARPFLDLDSETEERLLDDLSEAVLDAWSTEGRR